MHQLGRTSSEPWSTDDLLLAARHLGLKGKLTRTNTDRLGLTPLPALALLRDGRTVVLAQCDGQRVLLQDPSEQIQGGRPVIEPIAVFTEQWTGELLLVTSRASVAGELAKFDFSWFIPSLVKYRKLFGEVLVISLFLQLFALISPLFFQVVMDKVLVHNGLTTLDVLVIGLLVVVVFESVLTALRTCVVGTGDTVTESASAGTDTVQSSITWTLGSNLEKLVLTGTSAINGTGNTVANVLTGNSAANTLNGSSGADTLIGGTGNDSYVVDNTADIVTELASEGADSVNSSVTYTLSANVENLTLTGSTAINGTGNASDNVLNGNSAVNVLTGGGGNDTYIVGTGDTVTEAASAGIDTVSSSITWTLGGNLENLTLAGSGAINGTGNALGNVLTGNSAANVLTGGAGNDTYIVGTGDTVTEAASAGTDTVQSTVAWILGNNLENLTLTGSSAVNGTGNTLGNVLTGNSANNTLTGNAGNDNLNGGAGTDTLAGGTGNDGYVLGRGYGADTLQENDTTAGNTDVLQFLSGVSTEQIWLRKVSNNLEVSIIGTSDKATLTNWYLGNQYHVEQFKTSDGKTLLDSRVQNLVSAMAGFAPPAAGQTTLPPNYQTALAPVIAANWNG